MPTDEKHDFCDGCGWPKLIVHEGTTGKKVMKFCKECVDAAQRTGKTEFTSSLAPENKNESEPVRARKVPKGSPLNPLGLFGPGEQEAFIKGTRRGLLAGLVLGTATAFAVIRIIMLYVPGFWP